MGKIVLLGIPCLIRGFAAWDHDELDTTTTEKQQIDRGTVYIIIFPDAKKVKVFENESPRQRKGSL